MSDHTGPGDPHTPLLDADTVRGGLDSLAWLLNNAHHYGDADWFEWLASARIDREAAFQALERLKVAALRGEGGMGYR